MNFIVETGKKFDNGNPEMQAGFPLSAVDRLPEVRYLQRVESASFLEDGMAIPENKRRYNVTLNAALAARLDAVAAIRRKHRSTIIHWAVEDWLRRYEPGIHARLSGGRTGLAGASIPAAAPKPAESDPAADPRQIDLEDALASARSSFLADS